jgi:glycosyltransferase involved in cell wall biosynthesis
VTLIRLPLEGQLSPPRELNWLARAHPEAWIAWYDRRLEPWLTDPESWPGLARHGLEVLHLGCFQRTDLMVGSLGLVDFDSPWLLPGPRDRRFVTWLISPAAGLARAAAIRAVSPDRTGSLAGFLFELGARGICHGLSPVSEPALLKAPVPEEMWDRAPLSDEDLARLIRRGYGRKWIGFWLLGRLLSERTLPPATMGAALRGWMAKEPRRVDERALAALHPAPPEEDPGEDVDAVIPTLNRPEALRDVLRDLGAQTVPPRRVLVVGQGDAPPPEGEPGFELVFLSLPARGACTARNAALAEVRAAWVLLLDDDVRLQPGLISYLLRMARAWGVEAVNAAVHLPGEQVGSQGPRPWPMFASGASLVSTRSLREIGGFDERLDGGYGEDYELGIRLRLAGAGVLYAPGEPVLHLKLPVGGFRHPAPLPWSDDPVPPRPSPTVLYPRRKHHTAAMQSGYRLYYALKRLSGKPLRGWPREARAISREWERSAWWAARIAGE